MTETFYCPECNHAHELQIIRGEWSHEDCSELPAHCEGCGVIFVDDSSPSDASLRAAERRQMGIC